MPEGPEEAPNTGAPSAGSANLLPHTASLSFSEPLTGYSSEGTVALPPTAASSGPLATMKTEESERAEVADGDLSSDLFTCLSIRCATWARDSHDLFDYEARHVHKKLYFVKRSCRIFRTMLEVQLVLDGHCLPSQPTDYLLSVRHREGRYLIAPPEKNPQGVSTVTPKRAWLVVKQLPHGHYQLQEADVIKLGRFKLRVKQLVKYGPSSLELRLDDVETPHSTVTAEEAVTMQCRICLLEGGTDRDPLVCPCQCKGSIKFVHLDCLRHWINGRLSLTGDNQSKSFFFKQLQCELCKTPFPSAVVLNGERVSIVNFPKIEAPFIILENMGGLNRGLHVVSMEERKELRLGRGHESDMRIADVSISRYHATIRFADGEFILEDHNSKFGTLVALRKVQFVEPSHSLGVQVGRTVLGISLRKPPCDFDDVLPVSDDPMLSATESEQDDEEVPPPPGPPPSQSPGSAADGTHSWAGQQHQRQHISTPDHQQQPFETTGNRAHHAFTPERSGVHSLHPISSDNATLSLRTGMLRGVLLPVSQKQMNSSDVLGATLLNAATRICRPRALYQDRPAHPVSSYSDGDLLLPDTPLSFCAPSRGSLKMGRTHSYVSSNNAEPTSSEIPSATVLHHVGEDSVQPSSLGKDLDASRHYPSPPALGIL